MEQMGNLEMWNLVVGFLLPPVLSVLQQTRWSDSVRALVAFAAAVVAALGTVYFTHGIHLDGHLATSVLLIFVTATATYKNFWKPTGVSPAVERATNVGDGHEH